MSQPVIRRLRATGELAGKRERTHSPALVINVEINVGADCSIRLNRSRESNWGRRGHSACSSGTVTRVSIES